MGSTFLFECAKCGYRAKVAGGTARGFHLAVQTIQCFDCRQLFDVVTELKVPASSAAHLSRWKLRSNQPDGDQTPAKPPSFAAALNRLVLGSGQRFRWVRFKAMCPVSLQHRTRAWKQPGKCPRCGVFLDGNAIPYKIWD
jgi:hypothetical protein